MPQDREGSQPSIRFREGGIKNESCVSSSCLARMRVPGIGDYQDSLQPGVGAML